MKSCMFVSMVVLSIACSKNDGPKPGTESAPTALAPVGTTSITGSPAAASASASGSASAAAAPTGSTGAAPAGSPASYTGTYKATAGSLYVPEEKDWKGFRFRGEDAGDGLGDGTLTITIKGDGRVLGEGDGALGKFTLSGVATETGFSANIYRKDPTDGGFTGFLVGTRKESGLDGSMKLSLAHANVLREATFTAKK